MRRKKPQKPGWQKIFLEEYGATYSITIAAEKAGVRRRLVYTEREQNEDFKEAMDDIREKSIDIAENALLKAIDQGNITAIIFFLKTQAKHRGYVEDNFANTNATIKVEFVEGGEN